MWHETDWDASLESLEWLIEECAKWATWLEGAVYLRLYSMRSWYRHGGPMNNLTWLRLQLVTQGRMVLMLGPPKKPAAEEEWELIEVGKNGKSRVVSLYEAHDYANSDVQ
jgi:hypothetical protein